MPGAGKSSFLAAVLGELRGTNGRVKIQGSLAYVPQQPWVMSGTLRDNILFKKQARMRLACPASGVAQLRVARHLMSCTRTSPKCLLFA